MLELGARPEPMQEEAASTNVTLKTAGAAAPGFRRKTSGGCWPLRVRARREGVVGRGCCFGAKERPANPHGDRRAMTLR